MREKISNNPPEWLLREGLNSTDDQFPLLRSRIQKQARQYTPKRAAPSKHHSLLLLDDAGDTLLEAAAIIRSPTICHEFEPDHQRLSGSLPLLPGAASLAILRQGHEIYRSRIEQPPELSVTWPKGRLQRGKRYNLALKLSQPANPDEALLLLAIHWGEGRHRIIGISDVTSKLSFDPARLPGDRSWRLSITYQDGLSTTTQFSPRLSLNPLPPNLKMLKPREGATFVAGAPISLVAEVDDPQGDRGLAKALRWSIDDKPVGCGPQALVMDLEQGKYKLKLTIEGLKQPAIERRIKIAAAATDSTAKG
jgi:hypothetical protein